MKIKFLLLILIISATTKAQYHPTLQDGVVWKVNYMGAFGGGSATFRTLGDTLIAGHHYEKVSDGSPMNLYREDSVAQRIYYRRPSGVEDLLFDFSLNLNDTLSINWFNGFSSSWMTLLFQVDSVSQTGIQAGTRKLLRLNCGNCGLYPLYWLESVGNLYVLGPLVYNMEGIDFPMDTTVCQQRSGAQAFQYSPGIACDVAAEVDETGSVFSAIRIYPNPTQSKITIISPEPVKEVVVNNMVGQTVYSNYFYSNEVSINLAYLSSGLYIVKVGNKVYKIVKE